MPSQDFIGFSLTTFGELLIGVSILQVLWRLRSERRIDKKVIRSIYAEEIFTSIGLVCIVIGYFLQLPGI
jgi:hypothetical protein